MASTPILRAVADGSALSRHQPSPSALHCCCGRTDCALLQKNCSVLETVEKDVHTAAQLGQALLARHEAYMADAERDRLELTSRIERLELDKLELEADNATRIEENRHLLDQLELLNTTVSDSDAKIRSLEASLLSSQQTVRRLESASARAEDAERHLAALEEEQDKLHAELRATKEDARSHAQRFKEAQRGILDLQDELERIEIEARQEQERHAEVVNRMERQRDVEKQLNTAASRLKGAAATKTIQNSKSGGQVVGHFVRDLLQDNANLQLGIAELRELLMNSNDEIQSLREQLMHHQPVSEEDAPMYSTLQSELEPEMQVTPKVSQELHIHHHYHVSSKQDARKPKKKRPGLAAGIFAPPYSGASTPTSSGQWHLAQSPAPPALASPVRDTTPTGSMPNNGNWPVYSNPPSELASSLPSSPRSNKRNSMFDHGFMDSDVPTSPTTSFDPMSPTWRASHSKRPSEVSNRSFQTFTSLDAAPATKSIPVPNQHIYSDDTIHEEDEDQQIEELPSLLDHATSTEDSTTEGSEISRDDFMSRPTLHRAISHESIMSLTGGLDIHTLKARPSQMTLRPFGGVDAVVTVTGVTAHPTLSRGSYKRSDAALRDNFAGLHTPRAVSGPYSSQDRSPSPSINVGSLTKWAGWRPWGGSGVATPKADKERGRPTGINQAGSIPGFQEYWAATKRKGAPANVTTETVDRDALQEVLQE